jgi:hypothetical protein
VPKKVSKKQAEAALAAVKAQYSVYFEPLVIDGKDFGPTYPEPTLVWDYTESGHPAICWEEGPDDWAYLIGGGTSESDQYLYGTLSEEFGQTVKAPARKPAQIPASVFAEPIMSCVLGLYPA